MENGCFLSPLQASQRAGKIQPMQTISIGTHANAGFARQIDSMDQQRHMQQDMINKQQASFQWHGLMMIEVCRGKTVPSFTLQLVANANRQVMEKEEN
eukprot:scaffold30176_cov131-Skeletonema_dohrnii-CCMP3373.AAC.5